jgi:Secretion system C-terminal sorting domain
MVERFSLRITSASPFSQTEEVFMGTTRIVTVFVLALLFLVPIQGNSQNIVRVPPFSGTNYLNDFIMGDTLANGQRRDSSAVYVLTRGANYLSNALMRNIGWTLRLQANDTTGNVSKPVVYLYPGGSSQLPPGQFVDMRGNLTMKNIILSGYFEPIPGNVTGLQGALFNTTAAGLNLTLDSCILTNTNGNHVRTDQAPKVVKITNCIFANMGYLGRSNLGAGKGIDVRGGSVDSLIVVNNTFVNWQDRIIRHFASTANIQFLKFEHNTCVNGMSYHGFLSLGRLGRRAIIRDNLLVDAFALGQDTDAVRQAEFTDSGEKDAFGFARMTWIFSAPNDSTTWTVANNYYRVTPAGQAFYDSASILPIVANPALTAGSPLTYHINSKLGADSAIAFRTHTATLPEVPKLMTAMMQWYRRGVPPPDSGAFKTKATGTWKPQYDYDRRFLSYYRDTMNCAYSTANAIYSAGTGGYPVGDLNWFPSRKAAWLADPVSDVPVLGTIPEAFKLEQNYPNPFNPSTTISFGLPKETHVLLEVYDILGRKVATLVDEQRVAGSYTVTFDASHFGSGVYFYRIKAGGQSLAKRMLLVK